MIERDFSDKPLGQPFIGNALIVKRDPTGVYTNVPHLVVSHSLDGFEWGYGGSGPADLALNVIEALLLFLDYKGDRVKCYMGTCFTKAWVLHQPFKSEFISCLHHEGDKVAFHLMVDWVRDRL